jgi:hypothetical protein
MLTKPIRRILFIIVTAGLLSLSPVFASVRAQASTGTLFTQLVDPSGSLLLSSRREPDGSNADRYVWDNFTLQTTQAVTEINWIGGFDPSRFGNGGPVTDFKVTIYPSIAGGSEPAIALPSQPLVDESTGGNAGQTSIGTFGGIAMYSYAYTLPAPFVAQAGVKYWVHILALQEGSIPDWGFAGATGGNGSHYVRESGAGGDIRYRHATGDAAFTLLGPVSGDPTDIFLTKSRVDENRPANTIVGALSAVASDPNAKTFTFSLACAAPGVDDGSFNIFGTALRTSASFHFETRKTYAVCIRASSQGGVPLDKNFVITVNDLSYLPSTIKGSW